VTAHVFDSRMDRGNVVVTPEIRCRFLEERPGTERSVHSHDGAAEVFVVLQGHVEFEIEGELVVADPGQMVYVPPFAKHTLRAIDETATLFLCVAPHCEPSHTFFDPDGTARPVHGAWRD
jgi:mannose-6-phosphate isomerase-like protein (cupin superfamily)